MLKQTNLLRLSAAVLVTLLISPESSLADTGRYIDITALQTDLSDSISSSDLRDVTTPGGVNIFDRSESFTTDHDESGYEAGIGFELGAVDLEFKLFDLGESSGTHTETTYGETNPSKRTASSTAISEVKGLLVGVSKSISFGERINFSGKIGAALWQADDQLIQTSHNGEITATDLDDTGADGYYGFNFEYAFTDKVSLQLAWRTYLIDSVTVPATGLGLKFNFQ